MLQPHPKRTWYRPPFRVWVWSIVLAHLVVAAGCRSTSETAPIAPNEDAALRAVLAEQVEAWNRGDLDGFMAGYARTDTLRFASGGNERRGWQTALESYRQGYPDRAAMGTLTFEVRDVDLLAPRWALVFGAWRLQRAEDAPHGLFTLLFRKTDDGTWRIVHDHTSSGS